MDAMKQSNTSITLLHFKQQNKNVKWNIVIVHSDVVLAGEQVGSCQVGWPGLHS